MGGGKKHACAHQQIIKEKLNCKHIHDRKMQKDDAWKN